MAGFKRILQGVFILCFMLVAGLVAAAQTGGSPRLRVVHASPDSGPADFYVDGNLVFPNLPYKGVTDYAVFSPGNHTVRVVPAGAEGPVVLEPTLPLVDGKDYTLLAVGKRDNLQAQQFEDNNSPPPAGQVRVRIIHTSPDAPAVDICRAGQPDCPVTNLTFKNASGYVTLEAGTYNLEVRRAGTNEVILTQQDLRFVDGTVYSLFLVGLWQGEPGLQLIPRADTGRAPGQPPPTGAFLSPAAFLVVTSILAVLAGGVWVARRRIVRG